MTTAATPSELLAEHGFAVLPEWLDFTTMRSLARCARDRLAAVDAVPAAIGRGAARRRDAAVRGDSTAWLDAPHSQDEAAFAARLESLRATLNAALQLGLFEFEGHYACYPPGARYVRHLDTHRGGSARAVSFVLYLNEAWGADDGGALHLYDARAVEPVLRVAPRGGTAVCFLAERFEHEVLPARRERFSFTGWFRRREPGRLPFPW